MKVNIGKFSPRNGNRKINVKIEKFDAWSLDNTLSLIILPALIQLKQSKMGVPGDFVNDSAEDYNDQATFDFMKEDKDEVFEKGCDAWDDTIDKMIWSFQQIALGDYDSKYHHGEMDISWKKTDKQYPNSVTGKMESTYQMVDHNPDEHWYDSVGHQLHEERIQEGLDLFGKYFRSLWD